MSGIGKEFAVFLHAGLTGMLVVAVYLSLRVTRRLIPHALWAVNLEDALFWVLTSVYMFVQIYYTSAGLVRWYFVLGVVVGIVLMRIFVAVSLKIYKKMCDFTRKK